MSLSPAEQHELFSRLTPMQQLVMEVLAARYRLGHQLWTFTNSSGLSQAVKVLRLTGYIETMPGVIENTIRISLTSHGKTLVLDPEYAPPVAS